MTFGHYTAYVKKDEWVTYDDEKVKRCNLIGENAYLVFYKRVENKKWFYLYNINYSDKIYIITSNYYLKDLLLKYTVIVIKLIDFSLNFII